METLTQQSAQDRFAKGMERMAAITQSLRQIAPAFAQLQGIMQRYNEQLNQAMGQLSVMAERTKELRKQIEKNKHIGGSYPISNRFTGPDIEQSVATIRKYLN